MSVHCGSCRIPLKNEDVIVLNWANILTHINCHEAPVEQIIDIGTYEQIINKYHFFEDLRKEK